MARHIICGARLIMKVKCSIETAKSQGCAPVSEARDEAVWTAKGDRYGSASVVPGSDERNPQCS
jgi:hypothetical protein